MGWIEKEKTSPIDSLPVEGLFYLDGDRLAEVFDRDWTKGQKLPLIAFPSGEEFEIWPSSDPETIGIVHLFGLHRVVKKERALYSKRRPVE